jgi:hypothetical protein
MFVACSAVGALTLNAGAAIHYFTQDGTLYRSDNGAPHTSVALTVGGSPRDGFSSLAFDPSGTLWAHSRGDVFTVDPVTGVATPEFSLASGNLITFDFRDNNGTLELFGFVNRAGSGNDRIERFDSATGAFLGGFNVTGSDPGLPASGYDPDSGSYYLANGNDYTFRSYNVDGDAPGGTLIGPTGASWSAAGGAWFDGAFNMGYREGAVSNPGNDLVFGTVDTGSGLFSESFRFTDIPSSGPPSGGAFGYAIIPAPSAMALLGLAGAAAIRRRR